MTGPRRAAWKGEPFTEHAGLSLHCLPYLLFVRGAGKEGWGGAQRTEGFAFFVAVVAEGGK